MTEKEVKTQNTKCNFKCVLCENYNSNKDFCKVKGIKNCIKTAPTKFSVCDSYMVNNKLVYF